MIWILYKYDPYERYLDLTAARRERFSLIMKNMRERSRHQYNRAQMKLASYEPRDRNPKNNPKNPDPLLEVPIETKIPEVPEINFFAESPRSTVTSLSAKNELLI